MSGIKSFLKKPLFWGISMGMFLLIILLILLRRRSIVQAPKAAIDSVVNKIDEVAPTI